jgi:hypothetical protein
MYRAVGAGRSDSYSRFAVDVRINWTIRGDCATEPPECSCASWPAHTKPDPGCPPDERGPPRPGQELRGGIRTPITVDSDVMLAPVG